MHTSLFRPGDFFVGCNYWASHAGLYMWRDWNADIVEKDLKRLSDHGVQVLRIFPLWTDFQPLRLHTGYAQMHREVRMGEQPLPDTEAGRAGVDEVMVGRFQIFLDLCEKYRLKLIVGLLTGFMSGRMFVPEMLQGKNVLTDPEAIRWEIRFIRYMVRQFKEHPAIEAWDLGNECNCMAEVKSSAEAYCWQATISMAIRMEDPNRKIVSGMHGMRLENAWPPAEQGELLDVTATHPYPLFTPHCDTDPLNCMKSALHAAAESRYYADLSGKPCFAEEVGNLGPMMLSEDNTADYATACMASLWAHNCRGFLWWCANEQLALEGTPYDWDAVERELGLFRMDMTPKPVMTALKRFSDFVGKTGIRSLPDAVTDAVCILSIDQDTWCVGYGAFLMAKKAHMNLRFADCRKAIPESPVYIIPSVNGLKALPRRFWMDMIERVKNGATLYLSLDDCLISPFEQVTGLRVLTHSRALSTDTVSYAGHAFPLSSKYRLITESVGAEVLARSDKGDPAFTVHQLGKGKVYCLLYPVETVSGAEPGVTDGENAHPLEAFYRPLRSDAYCADTDCPTVGLTEHWSDDHRRILVLFNYEPYPQKSQLILKPGWRADKVTAMDGCALSDCELSFAKNSGMVIEVVKE